MHGHLHLTHGLHIQNNIHKINIMANTHTHPLITLLSLLASNNIIYNLILNIKKRLNFTLALSFPPSQSPRCGLQDLFLLHTHKSSLEYQIHMHKHYSTYINYKSQLSTYKHKNSPTKPNNQDQYSKQPSTTSKSLWP